jgi:type II secretory pathway component PulF
LSKSHALIYQNLSTLLDAGVPILRVLNAASRGLKGKLSKAFPKIAEHVSHGDDLAEAMTKQKRLFKPLDLMLIAAGEHSGNLPDVFKMLSEWHYFRLKLKRIIITGMLLPILLINVTAIIAPVPSLVFGGGWPAYVKEAIVILAVFYTPFIIILAVVYLTPKHGAPRRMLDECVLWIPVFGKSLKAFSLSRYCKCFAMLFKAGVPITDCADMAANSVGNVIIQDWLKGGAQSARQGNPIGAGFSKRLDSMFLNLWEVGEETGELDTALERLGEKYAFTAELLFTQFTIWMTRLAYFFVMVIMIIKIFEGYGKIMGGRAGAL